MPLLPQPNQPFEWVQAPRLALVCRPLASIARHLFTTRSWALGSRPLDADASGWAEVGMALDVPPGHLRRLQQVHGANAVVADAPSAARPDADIIVTNRSDLAVAVQAADCVPLLLADPQTGAVGAAHAGWRGLAARVPEATVRTLTREYGSRPADLVAAIGPSIGACCYEVGSDVRQAFARAFPDGDWRVWFADGRRPARWMFDTWASTRAQLEAAGIRPQRIFEARLCTACHPVVFCSYRRDGAPAGRMAAAITPGHDGTKYEA